MTHSSVVRVLVVDDSAYIRKVVSEMLRSDERIQVVGTAVNGRDALEKVSSLQPDVVTLDMIMPELDGVGFLREQMKRRPLPVVVVSIASEHGEMVVQAMEAGALEFVQKPTALATEKILSIQQDLIQKVLAVANVSTDKLPVLIETRRPVVPETITAAPNVDAVVLGISTGGPQALSALLPQLPGNFPVPIALVLHMPLGYTELFAARLNEISALEVLEARDGLEMRPGRALVARAGLHLKLQRQPDGRVTALLDPRPTGVLHCPSVDVLFQSAAEVYGERLLGVVMTGMGNDGMLGSGWIKARGGRIIAEAEESCVVFGMPRAVIEAGLADQIVPLHRIAHAIREAL